MRADLTVNESARIWIDRQEEWRVFDQLSFYNGAGAIFDPLGSLTEDQTYWAKAELIRNGHSYAGNVPRYRVLFAKTKHGLAPADLWLDCGGTIETLRAGYYIKVPQGRRDIVLWWEDSAENRNGPDSYGRPSTGKTDEEIDRILESVKVNGGVTAADAAKALGYVGSARRDFRSRGRVALQQTKRWQSTGDGIYWDVDDPTLPSDVKSVLVSIYLKRAVALVFRENEALTRLGVPDRLVVGWGVEGEGIDEDIRDE